MSASKKGLTLALVHVLLVAAVGVKLMIDRARYPSVWVATAPYDPDLPIRGRYVRLLAVVQPVGDFYGRDETYRPGRLEVRDGRLAAVPDEDGRLYFINARCGSSECVTLAEPLAFFIPEDIPDPSVRPRGEQLWVRVTVPPNGAPRPIELGLMKGGRLTPLRS